MKSRWSRYARGWLAIPALFSVSVFAQPAAVVYKSPSCECCSAWVDHLDRAGFAVEVQDTEDLHSIKQKVGLPYGMGSCHTAIIDGYVFEGHVPVEDIRTFLQERPTARGLAVPGMPAGENVEGMEVPGKRARYSTYLLPEGDGEVEVYRQHE